MGCGASQPTDNNQNLTHPEKQDKVQKASVAEIPQSDPKYAEHLGSFPPTFAPVAKEAAGFGAIYAVDSNVQVVMVLSNGDVYGQLFTELTLRELKGEKTAWSSFFKQFKHQLKKATFSGDNKSAKLILAADGKTTSTLELPLKFEGPGFSGVHKLLLVPLANVYLKCKAGDDSKATKAEAEGNAVRASIAESQQRIQTLNTEIEPLSKSHKQALDDAKAAKEQSDAVRTSISKLRNALECQGRDFLYPDGPARYTLHLPQAVEHRPIRKPGNELVMAQIRTTFNGDPLIPVGISDGADHEHILKILEKIDDWDFDVFALDRATHGTPLFTTSYQLLYKYGLVQHFNIDHTILCNFLQAVESGYHPNPYHNNTHAADVLQITHYIIHESHGNLKTVINMTENDLMACILAACMHDYDHPGFNNNFHIRTGAYLAILYNDRSVLENHHCTSIFELVKNPKFNIFGSMNWEQYKDIRDTMLEMVLSTDMGLHAKIYQTFRRRLTEAKEWAGKEDTRLAMTIAIKMADISNCCRPKNIYQDWAKGIAEEFYQQGDAEARLGLPVSPFMDRRHAKSDFPKGQISFMNYIVIPLFEAGATLLPNMAMAVDFAKQNKQDLLGGKI